MSAGRSGHDRARASAEPAVPPAPGRTWGDRLAPFLANKLAVIGAASDRFFLIVACIGAAIMYVPGWDDLYIDQRLRETLLRAAFTTDSRSAPISSAAT